MLKKSFLSFILLLFCFSLSAQLNPPFKYNSLPLSIDSLRAVDIDTNGPSYRVLKDSLAGTSALDNDSALFKRESLLRALQTMRYISLVRIKSDYTIVVNIPSATLLLFKKDSIILESKVVVGKTSTRTPLLASYISEIILYPYWFVPQSIATKELLPRIRKNIKFLSENSFSLLNKTGKIVDPYSVDWYQLSQANFPYLLRQSTGCDNSLGIIKLNFYTPFNIYLHDTPEKNLFNRTNRFYSHGCIRVEKAIQLAHFLLKENSIAVDTLQPDRPELNLNKTPITLPVKVFVPILVVYNTAWIDAHYVVRYFKDIYRRF